MSKPRHDVISISISRLVLPQRARQADLAHAIASAVADHFADGAQGEAIGLRVAQAVADRCAAHPALSQARPIAGGSRHGRN